MEKQENKEHFAALEAAPRPSLFLQTSFFGDYPSPSLLHSNETVVCDKDLRCLGKPLPTGCRYISVNSLIAFVDVSMSSYQASPLERAEILTRNTHTDLILSLIPPFATKRIKNTHLPPRPFRAEFHLPSFKSHSSTKWKSIEWRSVHSVRPCVTPFANSRHIELPQKQVDSPSSSSSSSPSSTVYLLRAHTRSFVRSHGRRRASYTVAFAIVRIGFSAIKHACVDTRPRSIEVGISRGDRVITESRDENRGNPLRVLK